MSRALDHVGHEDDACVVDIACMNDTMSVRDRTYEDGHFDSGSSANGLEMDSRRPSLRGGSDDIRHHSVHGRGAHHDAAPGARCIAKRS